MVRAAVMAVALVVPVGVAQANYYYGEGPYIGFSVGMTEYDVDLDTWGSDSVVSGTVDDSDVGVKFYWGYSLSSNFALELFYVNLGETEFEGIVTDGGIWEGDGEFPGLAYTKNTGYGFSALGKLPIGEMLELFGKAGIYRWTTRLRGVDDFGPFRSSDSGSDMLLGGGMAVNVTDRSTLRLEWERFIKVYDIYDVDMISLGFVHKF